jgi:hypothetical protein
VPNEANAHPHSDGRVAVVHNGIIENFQDLRRELTAQGHLFESETDTEVVVHLISALLATGLAPKAAPLAALQRLKGAFALAILFVGYDGMMIGARKGSPLAVGYGEGEMFLGSDALALAPLTRRIAYLEDGDFAVLTANGAEIFDASGEVADRPVHVTQFSGAMIGKGAYRHFMLKEIYEQATVIGDTLNSHFNPVERTITLPPMPFDLGQVKRVTLVACGTSYYRDGRQVLDRALRPGAGGARYRIRIPLPLRAGGGGGARHLHLPVRRDGGHPGRLAFLQGGGDAHPGHRQRAGKHDVARGLRRPADAGRAGDRRRFDPRPSPPS